MALVPITILQKHLDTTLQLIISLSSTMTADELIMMRVRLTEASIVLGQVLVELEHNDADVNENAQPVATLQNTHAAGDNSGNHSLLDRVSVHRDTAGHSAANSAHRGPARRPTTRSTTRHHPTARSLASSQRARNVAVPLIEMESDDD